MFEFEAFEVPAKAVSREYFGLMVPELQHSLPFTASLCIFEPHVSNNGMNKSSASNQSSHLTWAIPSNPGRHSAISNSYSTCYSRSGVAGGLGTQVLETSKNPAFHDS